MIPFLQDLVTLWVTMAWMFLVMLSMAYPLERLWPARDQYFFRRGWATDFVFFIMQHTVVEGAMLSLFTCIANAMFQWAFIDSIHRFMSSEPLWFQFLIVMMAADILGYSYHRCMHTSRWLWPLHAIHHSIEEPDWLSAHREHPIDTILGSFCITLPFIVLGVSMGLVTPILLFRGFWSLYLHSNIAIGVGPMQVLIGSPQLHRWHHSKDNLNCNYSNYSPWLDVMFGSYYCPPTAPNSFGVSEKIALNYHTLLLHPFRCWLSQIKGKD